MTKRALTLEDVLSYKPKTLPFQNEWMDFVGEPEIGSTWIIWGSSFNGKTRLALQLQKCIAQFCKTAYNSLEEGLSNSFKQAVEEENFSNVKRNFQLWDKISIAEMKIKLHQKRSPDVIFIDSVQYAGMTYADYKVLKKEFPRKTFIFISHADGKEPKGNVARSIRYDASIKIYVEGYKAFPQSRFGGGKELVIYQKGAEEYWNFK
jgi:hypothetical protein